MSNTVAGNRVLPAWKFKGPLYMFLHIAQKYINSHIDGEMCNVHGTPAKCLDQENK